MSFQETVSAERVHIGFFGLRNAGKSSLVNALAGQAVSVVSDVAGTTTDPVRKAMELLPLGPVLLMDTPGLDDAGDLGDLRVQRAREVLARTDIAVLVSDARTGPGPLERDLAARLKERGVPWVAVYSKADLLSDRTRRPDALDGTALYTSAATGEGIEALKARLGAFAGQLGPRRRLLDGLLSSGDLAVLVTPIDASAPKGRLILPQQQTMRELLDLRCPFLTCQDTELSAALSALREPPKLVITDSQAFARVADIVPEDVPLTSFSILFARYKGELRQLMEGAEVLSELKDGDKVLIAEGCTHRRQCQDIGTVKLPGWIRAFSGAEPDFSFTSGGTFPEDLSGYALVVHCGGCMLNGKEMARRMEAASAADVPMVNYGAAIAQMHGILSRSLRPFPGAAAWLDAEDAAIAEAEAEFSQDGTLYDAREVLSALEEKYFG